ncbi:Uncharacterised protein [Legionella lansingensis]|uniref:Uncharacterized protein n=1 Tax=Legionella lansingensis TaxID=45067 RepID=A0A0W0VJU9_9GAMM|nr:hypothetical protein [Legionella lansingensis]KTD20384.1 hypothetical protein Llan_1885 [Legionella lansingensis]SNV51565.1 Uncharacterised protein [Legionella lansingensis]
MNEKLEILDYNFKKKVKFINLCPENNPFKEKYQDEEKNVYYASKNNFNRATLRLKNIKNISLLQAEYAVFSGQLLRLILGNIQPGVYLATTRNNEYFRVSEEIKGFKPWSEVCSLSGEDLYFNWNEEGGYHGKMIDAPIHGLTFLLLACQFVGEIDWDDDNFGFVKIGDSYYAVRIDPANSFHPQIITSDYTISDMYNLVSKFFLSQISACCDSDPEYMSEYIDYKSRENRINKDFETLFSNPVEIKKFIEKIISINDETIDEISDNIFIDDHGYDLSKALKKRLQRYKLVFNSLKQQGTYFRVGRQETQSNKTSNTQELDKNNPNEDRFFSNKIERSSVQDKQRANRKRKRGDDDNNPTDVPKNW